MHAVGRIAYRGWIDNVQVSWVKAGIDGARQALQAGCNDLGGTLMDENISRAAGASHGQELDDAELPRDRRAARPPARAAHHALRPHRRPWAAAAARRAAKRPRAERRSPVTIGIRGRDSRRVSRRPRRARRTRSTSSASATRSSTC